jgi:hypothetical protein
MEPHVAVFDKSARKEDTFSSRSFGIMAAIKLVTAVLLVWEFQKSSKHTQNRARLASQ